MASWWLSYADADGFRGACIVTGPDFLGACSTAKKLELSPGGQVRGVEIPAELAPHIEDKWRLRLLSKADAQEFDLAMDVLGWT